MSSPRGFKLQPRQAVLGFNSPSPEFIAAIQAIVGEAYCLTSPEVLEEYGHDWTEDLLFLPDVVVRPANTLEVQAIILTCNQYHVACTPSGARTGLSGGMLPVAGGVVLSLERMNRILEIDTRNLQVTVQPGVITQVLQEAVETHGLYYPPDPSSRGSCFIGGNLAENAGGAHAVKYGITKDYVLALVAVTGSGEIIRTGAKVLKNSTGYNITQLLVGSEGTLAVITEATLKLVPQPKFTTTLLIPFPSAEDACAAVSAVFRAGVTPAALEFMERDAIEFGQKYLNINTYTTEGIGGHLLVELDGDDTNTLFAQSEAIAAVAEAHRALDIIFADEPEKRKELWRIRRCLGEAVKGGENTYKEEDTVVPRAELPALLRKVKDLGAEFGFRSVCYGHAGDGNLHINILKDNISDDKWENELPIAITALFEFVKHVGGTLSGEHGIGWVQRRYMPIAFSSYELGLFRSIKQAFDPNGILNPGKILP